MAKKTAKRRPTEIETLKAELSRTKAQLRHTERVVEDVIVGATKMVDQLNKELDQYRRRYDGHIADGC